jgi:HlyD family secretion protein
MKRLKRLWIALALLSVAGIGVQAYRVSRPDSGPVMRTVQLSRGDIVDVIATTGTLQAVTMVQVGSQVSGNISWLGADFNSIVHKGQVIAKLDASLFEAEVAQASASLAQARANLVKAGADVQRDTVGLTDAKTKYARALELSGRSLLPASDLDAAKVAVDTAQAQVQSSQAQVQSAQAQIGQAQAQLNQSEVNAQHAVITAPIDGIVIQRSVDVGQTVAASLSSPNVFAIAADLAKMQVSANIDEADIGRIGPGQPVTFKVDAFPTETFTGTVSQVRLQPTVVSNVTTYTAIIDVPNAGLKLKPGMTANAKVEVARRNDVLRVSNAALRFRPSKETFAALNQDAPADAQPAGARVWVYADDRIESVRVQLGITNGTDTELVNSDLQPGTVIATGLATATTTSTATTTRNPLMGSGPTGPPRGR